MTDIVERLRNWVSYSNGIPSQPEICKEAADEIERLRAENEKLRTMPMKYRRMEFNAQLQKENEELRAELAQRGEPVASEPLVTNEMVIVAREIVAKHGEVVPRTHTMAEALHAAMLVAKPKSRIINSIKEM